MEHEHEHARSDGDDGLVVAGRKVVRRLYAVRHMPGICADVRTETRVHPIGRFRCAACSNTVPLSEHSHAHRGRHDGSLLLCDYCAAMNGCSGDLTSEAPAGMPAHDDFTLRDLVHAATKCPYMTDATRRLVDDKAARIIQHAAAGYAARRRFVRMKEHAALMRTPFGQGLPALAADAVRERLMRL